MGEDTLFNIKTKNNKKKLVKIYESLLWNCNHLISNTFNMEEVFIEFLKISHIQIHLENPISYWKKDIDLKKMLRQYHTYHYEEHHFLFRKNIEKNEQILKDLYQKYQMRSNSNYQKLLQDINLLNDIDSFEVILFQKLFFESIQYFNLVSEKIKVAGQDEEKFCKEYLTLLAHFSVKEDKTEKNNIKEEMFSTNDTYKKNLNNYELQHFFSENLEICEEILNVLNHVLQKQETEEEKKYLISLKNYYEQSWLIETPSSYNWDFDQVSEQSIEKAMEQYKKKVFK